MIHPKCPKCPKCGGVADHLCGSGEALCWTCQKRDKELIAIRLELADAAMELSELIRTEVVDEKIIAVDSVQVLEKIHRLTKQIKGE